MLLGDGIGTVLGRVLLWIPLLRLLLPRHLHTLANPFFGLVFDFPLNICISEDEESRECLLLGVITRMQDDVVRPFLEVNE